FDAVGRLKAQTDAAGRTTEYSPDVVKRCAASVVMNSPPLTPLPGSYRAST
ncbi:RHS repeat protein, partial [Escherichia coli]|nr:RHS repeat protein [Escherichia coli]